MTGRPAAPGDARVAVATRLTPVLFRVGRRIRPVGGELSVGHFSMLGTLYRLGPQRPSDLARIERFAPPAVTRIVGVLEERGLVVRQPSPDDARSSLVEITDEGRRVLVATRREQAKGVASLLSVLDDDELVAVSGALDALEKVAEAALVAGELVAAAR
jgi:DNA-binding MarR family transcriptional regulator